jgi:hypothetical protein
MLIPMQLYEQPPISSSKSEPSQKEGSSALSEIASTLQRVWLAPSKDYAVAGEIFTPIKEGDLLHHAEILTLRQITTNLEAIAQELQASRRDMTEMKVDVAIIKERQTQSVELKQKISALEGKVDVLELRNTKQDGAYSLVALLKDFGPWIFGLLVLAWSLFGKVKL